jgi:site-specific recombinase XerD
MSLRVSILFYLKKSKQNKKGKVLIYVRITVNGIRSEISTGIQVAPEMWNQDKAKVMAKSEESKNINARLKAIDADIQKQYLLMENNDQLITSRELANRVSGKSVKKYTLLQAFTIHNDELEQKIGVDCTRASFNKYRVTFNKVQSFIKYKYNETDLWLEQINHNFVTSFDLYLKTQDKNQHNTASKHLTNLKKIIRMARANEWMTNDPFGNFKITKKATNRQYLNAQELKALEEKNITIERLDKVRDAFLFSCYTGLSYSDLAKLTSKDITIDVDGKKKIVIYRQKTKSRSAIPLLPGALRIIEKYSNSIEAEIKGTLLPINSNQKMNAYLKEIAVICGIDKKLGFHSSRHTFASTLMLENGVPIEVVRDMLGHSSVKTTEIYAKITDIKVSKEMSVLEKKLEDQKKVLEIGMN